MLHQYIHRNPFLFQMSLERIWCAFDRFYQLKEFCVHEESPKVFVISMASSKIADIEEQCEAIAKDYSLTLKWLQSQRQMVNKSTNEDEPKQQVSISPAKLQITSVRRLTRIRLFMFETPRIPDDVRPTSMGD